MSRFQRPARILAGANTLIVVAVAVALATSKLTDESLGGGSRLDVFAFAAVWSFVLITPIVAVIGIALGRRAGMRSTVRLQGVSLVVWAMAIVASLTVVH